MSASGETVAVLTLTEADVRPLTGREILHARKLAFIYCTSFGAVAAAREAPTPLRGSRPITP
ncbi:MAG: hypothetical protein M3418_05740 [Gemmatimonadota bacterium]|nr:hypothetical protein [Gemmatimonadota bacterium]